MNEALRRSNYHDAYVYIHTVGVSVCALLIRLYWVARYKAVYEVAAPFFLAINSIKQFGCIPAVAGLLFVSKKKKRTGWEALKLLLIY